MPWCVAVDFGNNASAKNRGKDTNYYSLPKYQH